MGLKHLVVSFIETLLSDPLYFPSYETTCGTFVHAEGVPIYNALTPKRCPGVVWCSEEYEYLSHSVTRNT